MIQIQFRIPYWMIKEIDKLVREGVYSSRSAFIREAVRDLLRRERVYPFVNRGIPK